MQLHRWPKKVQELTAGQSCVRDCIGQSGAQVWLFDRLVLKTGRGVPAIRAEKERLAYLAGRLPVPRVVHYEEVHGRAFLLMERLPGRMLCDEVYLHDPQQLVRLLAEAYTLLRRADLSDCPFDAGTGALLPAARVRVQRKQCSVSDAEPGTYGPGGFQNPAALLAWLEQHVPPCEPGFVHGDFCLPNILVQGGTVSGFVDVGHCGLGDGWQDLALGLRSLQHNLKARLGADAFAAVSASFFDCLGLTPDHEKIKYYILLDELF